MDALIEFIAEIFLELFGGLFDLFKFDGKRRKPSVPKRRVKMPWFPLSACWICALLFPLFAIALILFPEIIADSGLSFTACQVILWSFAVPSFLILPFLSIKIRWDEDAFEYRNLLWIKHKYAFRDIREVRVRGRREFFYILFMRDGRRIHLNTLYSGLALFRSAVHTAIYPSAESPETPPITSGNEVK